MKQTSEALPVISRQKEKSKVGGREELDLEKEKDGKQRENNPGICYCRATVVMIPAAPVDYPVRFATGQKPQRNTLFKFILLRDILCEGFKVGLQWDFLYISTNLIEQLAQRTVF